MAASPPSDDAVSLARQVACCRAAQRAYFAASARKGKLDPEVVELCEDAKRLERLLDRRTAELMRDAAPVPSLFGDPPPAAQRLPD